MSTVFFQFTLNPNPCGIEVLHAGAAGAHPNGMGLGIKTFEPGPA
jgi:hypothetical protein